jgi:hypothetical protein
MKKHLDFLGKTLRAQLAKSPALTAVGLLGVALGGVCATTALIRGAEIAPEGNLLETATFDGAVGIFVLTLAVLAPGVGWPTSRRRRWTRLLIGLVLFSYGIETLQAFRGLDPRFSRVAGPLDQIAGGVFFLVALAIMCCFIALVVAYFRGPADSVAIAVRYGSIASFIAFGVGICMSVVTRGRYVPQAGNLLALHAAGFHGLQAVPLVALLLQWSGTAERISRRRVHVAGLAWLGACLAIAWQSGSGRTIEELSAPTAAAALCAVVFGMTAVRAARHWFESPTSDDQTRHPARSPESAAV